MSWVNYKIESSNWSVTVLVNNSIIKLVGVGRSFSFSQQLPQNGGEVNVTLASGVTAI